MVRSVLKVNALIYSVFDGQETSEIGEFANLRKTVLFYLMKVCSKTRAVSAGLKLVFQRIFKGIIP